MFRRRTAKPLVSRLAHTAGPLSRLAHTACPLKRLAHSAAAPSFDLEAIRNEIIAEHALHTAAALLKPAMSPSTFQNPGYDDRGAPWFWLDRELSSNVAGETGAVCIYDGAACALALRSSTLPTTLQFVEEHRAAERAHLDLFAALLPTHKHTRLLPAWRAAGFALGFAPALLSDRALFLTVESVETFVEVHYGEQIGPLKEEGRCPRLVELLEHCCADEVHHRDDAQARRGHGAPNALERAWMAVVRLGSAVAAEVARRA